MKSRYIAIPLALACLLAGFSSSSLSTAYYWIRTNAHASSCTPVYPERDLKRFEYFARGVENIDPVVTGKMICPVNMPGDPYQDDEFAFVMTVYGVTENTSGYLECQLKEVQNTDQAIRQSHVKGTTIYGLQKLALVWPEIVRMAPQGESSFIISCKMPPSTGLGNITVRVPD